VFRSWSVYRAVSIVEQYFGWGLVGLKHGVWLVRKRSHHLFCSLGLFEVISKRYISLLELYACSARGYLVGGCNACYRVAD